MPRLSSAAPARRRSSRETRTVRSRSPTSWPGARRVAGSKSGATEYDQDVTRAPMSDSIPSATPARRKLDDLPDAPGVYLYRDVTGRIIYVGKAKSLRSRVRSYFQPGGSGQFPRTDALVGE